MRIPELVAHRGHRELFPENTLIGVEAAIRSGARFVEVDVQLTSDEVPVLLHDQTLQRVCGIKRAVHQTPYDELRTLRPSEFNRFGYRFADVRIPNVAELGLLLQRHPGVGAFVELKRSSIRYFGEIVVVNRVLRELEPVAGQVVIISSALRILLTARQHGFLRVGAILSEWSQRKDDDLHELKPDYVICEVSKLPRWGRLRAEPAKLMVYEVADAVLALRLAKRGVDFVETFAIREMFEQLEFMQGKIQASASSPPERC